MALTVLLGGARSGKSTLAVRKAAAADAPVVFVATAEGRDEEMAERIARHRAERPDHWRTVEEPVDLLGAVAAAAPGDFLVVDCLSLWVSNLLETGLAEDDVAHAAVAVAAAASARPGTTIAVTNEVGMGLVPVYELGRRYRDLLGRVNAIWAAAADEALLVVAGRALVLEVP